MDTGDTGQIENLLFRGYSWCRATILLAAGAGLLACHSTRLTGAPQNSTLLPSAIAPVNERPFIVSGVIRSSRDSVTVIPGTELVFTSQKPSAVINKWRELSKPDGGYQITVLSNQTYRVELSVGGITLDLVDVIMPATAADSVRLVKNFYVDYVDDCCIDDFGAGPMIWFDTNKASIRAWSTSNLEYIARVLKANSTIAVIVEGHAEPKELPQFKTHRNYYLDELSQKRADAACAYLLKRGVRLQQLFTLKYGARTPVALNVNPENRQLNRRVEFHSMLTNDSKTVVARGVTPYKPPAKSTKPRSIRKAALK